MVMYDVVVAGGSIAGLLCAREVARGGFSVMVLEDDFEIGTPEHCSGLVSSVGLEELGIVPSQRAFEQTISATKIFAPDGKVITINAKRQNVIETSRRELDKQVAYQAQKNGAQIRVNTFVQELGKNAVRTKDQSIDCKVIVDARGISSLVQANAQGILPSAQYEIYAEWISQDTVEVHLDQEKYPGFFAWVIPSSKGRGKVGVAGCGIRAAVALEEFLAKKGQYSVIRKIFAPVWTGGAVSKFVDGNIVRIGDAAGQTKPTTAGGIYTSGMGGILAARAITKYLKSKNPDDLQEYQAQWNKKFGAEFQKQVLARKILEKIDNNTMCKILASVTPGMLSEIEKNDFDFHSMSLVKLLGVKGSLKTAHALVGGRIKKILHDNLSKV